MSDQDQGPVEEPDEGRENAGANSLEEQVRRVIDYHCTEFTLSYATLIGVLEMVKHSIIQQWMYDEGDESKE
jgi:hypothetical protein